MEATFLLREQYLSINLLRNSIGSQEAGISRLNLSQNNILMVRKMLSPGFLDRNPGPISGSLTQKSFYLKAFFSILKKRFPPIPYISLLIQILILATFLL